MWRHIERQGKSFFLGVNVLFVKWNYLNFNSLVLTFCVLWPRAFRGARWSAGIYPESCSDHQQAVCQTLIDREKVTLYRCLYSEVASALRNVRYWSVTLWCERHQKQIERKTYSLSQDGLNFSLRVCLVLLLSDLLKVLTNTETLRKDKG